MKHVLITGAGGFIGGTVAGYFAAQGYRVTALYRGRAPSFPQDKRITPVQTDLRAPQGLPERYDILVHCAAVIPARAGDANDFRDGNETVSRFFWDHAVAAGARHIIYCSSMSVYGRVQAPEVREDTPIIEPDAYGASKLAGEYSLADTVGGDKEISALAIRLPGIVGAGSHDNFLSNTARRITTGETVTARNPDALFNNIVHVEDLATFMGDWCTRYRRGFHVTNIAALDAIPIHSVLTALFKGLGQDERVIYESGGSPPFLISLARALELGFKAATVQSSVERFARDWERSKN